MMLQYLNEQNSFIEKNKANLSIEYQLTYLNDGSYKLELKTYYSSIN